MSRKPSSVAELKRGTAYGTGVPLIPRTVPPMSRAGTCPVSSSEQFREQSRNRSEINH
ncbi:MAG: hypothetical protein AAFX46_01200 [Cyanobacteria bacterium J06636_27]